MPTGDAASIQATGAADASGTDAATALAHAAADGKKHRRCHHRNCRRGGCFLAGARRSRPGAPTPLRATATTNSADRSAKARGAATESQADKDLAREAWRANRPDIRVSGTQASILIPIKGSIDGGTYKVLSRIHTVIITLPRAASLNTQHFYRLNKHGFQVLWTDQAETNARAKDGTKLRLVLGVPGTPQVELRDDFVRVTIPRPEAARTATPEEAEVPAEEN